MVAPQILIRDPQSIRTTAGPVFYSENTFMMDDPDWAKSWLEQIGRENVEQLVKLRIFVSALYNPGPHPELFGRLPDGPKWCKLFEKLASEATGLQNVYISWDAERTSLHRGGGFDVNLVRALARIKGVQQLEIGGYYAKEWPAYLESELGIEIIERQGGVDWHSRELQEFQHGVKDLNT